MSKRPTTKTTVADQPAIETSPDVAAIASELLRVEPADIVALGSATGPSVDDFLAKVKAVAGSALRQTAK